MFAKDLSSDKYNYTFSNGFFKDNSKFSLMKSAFNSIKNKNYSEFIINVYNRKFRRILLEFLDPKSILNFTYICREIFKTTRKYFYNIFYKKLINDKNNEYIHKILNNTLKYCSDKIKFKIRNKEIKQFYKKLQKKSEIYDELILKDLPRTFPEDPSFNKGKINYQKLYRILTCYSNYNKKIGYAQGINFICGHALYLYSSEEEEVFEFFEGLINLMNMDNIIGIGNEKKMLSKLNRFSRILKKYVPEIIDYFDDGGISHDFFTTGWILTLFSASMDRDYLIIVWCFMII